MRSHIGSTRRYIKTSVAALSIVLITSGPALTSMSAHADDVDSLITSMEEISLEASAKNEEVKQLELDIEEGESRLESLREESASAEEQADAAVGAQQQHQGVVNGVAGAKYRGLMIDPATNAMGARNPQNAIDRAAYLGTLARGSERAVDRLAEATAEAGKAYVDASRVIAEAEFQHLQLETKQRELDSQKADLEERIAGIETQVGSLRLEDQIRWRDKNNPIADIDLSSFAGTGAVAAAMSKLGSPYGWGAAGPGQFDCSGLMYWAFQQHGQEIPRTSQAQLAGGSPVSRTNLQPGDIVGFYPGVTHVGMYIGDGQLVHASDYGVPVQVVAVDSMPWAGAVRY